MSRPVEGVDARTDRVAQSTVGIALLAGFVFRLPLVVPVVLVLLAVGAAAGPRANPLHVVFERGIAPRLPRRTESTESPIPQQTVREQDALGAGLLALASLAFVFGVGLAGWGLAIVEAVIAIVAATTRVHVVDRFHRGL